MTRDTIPLAKIADVQDGRRAEKPWPLTDEQKAWPTDRLARDLRCMNIQGTPFRCLHDLHCAAAERLEELAARRASAEVVHSDVPGAPVTPTSGPQS